MDDWKNTIADITRSITKTSGDLLKTTKLSMALVSEEGNLKALYMELGKKVHEIYAYGGSLGKFFDEKYKELQAVEAKIEDLRAQMDAAKGTRSCPACGHTAARLAEFCPKCGKSMDGAAQAQKPDNTPEPMPAQPVMPMGKKCNVCGTENDPADKFCLSCGRML